MQYLPDDGQALFDPDWGLTALLKTYRAVEKDKNDDTLGAHGQSLRLALLSNYSTQFLEMGLKLGLASRGIDAEIFAPDFNQWEAELVNPQSRTAEFRPDVVILSLTSILLAYREAADDPNGFATRLGQLVESASEHLGARFVVTLPEPLEEEQDPTCWAYEWRTQLSHAVSSALPHKAVLVDLAPLISKLGSENWYAGRFVVNGKFNANPETTAAQSDYLAAFIAAIVRRPTRLVVVDLDDTLWGGIVGEVGWEGVNIDLDETGYGYIRLQRFLKGLHDKGVLLAVISKNNREDALEVFRNRPEMILHEEHFAELRINWEPKSTNLAAIFESLNLTPIGTAFIDDSPSERDEIRHAFPDVFVPEFPNDFVDLVPELLRTGQFSVPVVTRDDLNRQIMYKEEKGRKDLRANLINIDAFYESLDLKLTAQILGPANEQRVLDLIAKTNQFNLTTRRHNRDKLVQIAGCSGNMVYGFNLTDRYGSYGTVGAVVALRDGDVLKIDSWVLSCRAMGRTVEQGIIRYIAEKARADGIKRIVGEFIPTQKNMPVADLYVSLGFDRMDSDGETLLYELDLEAELPQNRFVAIE